jgi:hypothetical protein
MKYVKELKLVAPNPSSHTRLWGSLRLLTEMSTKNIKKNIMFLGSKVLPAHRADNLAAICEPIV